MEPINEKGKLSWTKGFPATMLELSSWPTGAKGVRERPTDFREARRWDTDIKWLTDPPLSTFDRYTPLPVQTYGAFLDPNFWNAHCTKYGSSGLKLPTYMNPTWGPTGLGPPLVLTAMYRPSELRTVDVARALGSNAALRWTNLAEAVLRLSGQDNIAEYLRLCTEELADVLTTPLRFHFEKKLWPRADAALRIFVGNMRLIGQNAMPHLAAYEMAQPQAAPGARLQAYLDCVRQFQLQESQLRRLIETQVQYLQYIAGEFLRLPPNSRDTVDAFLTVMVWRIESVLRPATQYAADAAYSMARDMGRILASHFGGLTGKSDVQLHIYAATMGEVSVFATSVWSIYRSLVDQLDLLQRVATTSDDQDIARMQSLTRVQKSYNSARAISKRDRARLDPQSMALAVAKEWRRLCTEAEIRGPVASVRPHSDDGEESSRYYGSTVGSGGSVIVNP